MKSTLTKHFEEDVLTNLARFEYMEIASLNEVTLEVSRIFASN